MQINRDLVGRTNAEGERNLILAKQSEIIKLLGNIGVLRTQNLTVNILMEEANLFTDCESSLTKRKSFLVFET